MKLLMTQSIQISASELVVPKRGAAEWKLIHPLFDKEILKQILDWTVADYNVTYNGFTLAVIEMDVTQSKNIYGRYTTAQGQGFFLAIDKIEEPKYSAYGEIYYQCFKTFTPNFSRPGLLTHALSAQQDFKTSLFPPNLETKIIYELTRGEISLIIDICPDQWLDVNTKRLSIKMESFPSLLAAAVFGKLGIDLDSKILYASPGVIVKDEHSYYTFGDLIGCIKQWLISALVGKRRIQFVRGPDSDFEGDKLNFRPGESVGHNELFQLPLKDNEQIVHLTANPSNHKEVLHDIVRGADWNIDSSPIKEAYTVLEDGQIFDTRGNKLKLEDGVYGLSKFDSINVPTSEEYLKVFKPEDLNQVGQIIEVDCGVVVSDSLGKMVGLKINLASGCWEYSVDGNWIAI